jgi:hypothetical protein
MPTKQYHQKPGLAERYRVTTRSIDRWVEKKVFPSPDIRLPNGRPAWSDETIERHEQQAVAIAAAQVGRE